MSRATVDKTAEIIVLILKANDGSIHYKTRLVKVLYMLDRLFHQEHGRTLSGMSYKSYYYGPYSHDISIALEMLISRGVIEEQIIRDAAPNASYEYQLKYTPQIKLIQPEEKEFILTNTPNLLNMTLTSLLDEVYDTEEYKKTDLLKEIKF